jgi:hypothetical protein
MRNLILISFIFIKGFCLNAQIEFNQLHFNLINSIGFSKTWSKVYQDVPYYNASIFSGVQSTHVAELQWFFNQRVGIGIGAGINLRTKNYYSSRNYSDKYYFSFQFFNPKRNLLTQLDFGTVKGVVTSKMLFQISVGVSIKLLQQNNFELKLRTFFEYNYIDSENDFYMYNNDWTSPSHKLIPFTNYFLTASLNTGLVMNFKSKPKVIMNDLHE